LTSILNFFRHTAVSYTWGSDEKTIAIQIDSKVFLIRANLESLLRSVRGRNYDCWLWIDAICIDQTSDKERSHQVRTMGKKYSNANTVLDWLGSYDQEIVETFEFMSTATSFKDSQTSVEAYCQHEQPKEYLYCRSGLPLVWECNWQHVTKICGL
jgi:hypothetical protein